MKLNFIFVKKLTKMSNFFLSTDKYGNKRQWFYLLNGKTSPEGKYSTGLLDYNSNIEGKLVVCSQPEENRRLFSLFDSHIDFFELNESMESKNRHFYEVIFGQAAQKPHFDIDFDLREIKNVNPENVLELLIDNIIKSLQEVNVTLNLEKDLLIYTSHGVDKKSYHVIVNNYCHSNNIEARGFYELVISKIAKEIIDLNCIDPSVYSVKQQFRILGSSKPGKNRIKVLQEEFTYLGIKYIHKIDLDKNTSKYDKLLSLHNLEESLISFTPNCKILDSFVSKNPKKTIEYRNDNINLTNDIARCCMLLLERSMKLVDIFSNFTINKIDNGLILLKIKASYNCLICKRIHEAENPYLRINIYSQVYYYCRRSNSNLLLGYIEHEFLKENTLDLNLTSEMKNNIEVKFENLVGLTPIPNLQPISQSTSQLTAQTTSQSISQPISQSVQQPSTIGQIWNTDVLGTLNQVASLTAKKKTVTPKICNNEVMDMFENTEDIKFEVATDEIDDLW